MGVRHGVHFAMSNAPFRFINFICHQRDNGYSGGEDEDNDTTTTATATATTATATTTTRFKGAFIPFVIRHYSRGKFYLSLMCF